MTDREVSDTRTGLPPGKTHPPARMLNNVAQTATGESLEAKSMMLAHQPIPLRMFAGPCKTNRHLARLNCVAETSLMTVHNPEYTESE